MKNRELMKWLNGNINNLMEVKMFMTLIQIFSVVIVITAIVCFLDLRKDRQDFERLFE